jgi:RNase P protein component
MARIAKSTEIQALLEKELKSRRKVILVCYSLLTFHLRVLLILNSPKRSAVSANKSRRIVKSVVNAGSLCIAVGYDIEGVSYCC